MASIVNSAHRERGRFSSFLGSVSRERDRPIHCGPAPVAFTNGCSRGCTKHLIGVGPPLTAEGCGPCPGPRKPSVRTAGQSKRRAHPKGVPVRFQLGGRAADSETVVRTHSFFKTGHRAAVQSKATRSGTVAHGGVAGWVSQPLR